MKTGALIALSAVLVLGACVNATPYQLAGRGGEGFVDQQLEAGKYRVTFKGNTLVERATAENYVLYRAAEVTLAAGFDHFVLADQTSDALSSYYSTGYNSGFGGGGFGGGGFFYGGGFGGFGGSGFGGITTTNTRERQAYVVGAVIQAGRGPKPADNAKAYDARSVIESIGPALVRPKAKG